MEPFGALVGPDGTLWILRAPHSSSQKLIESLGIQWKFVEADGTLKNHFELLRTFLKTFFGA